MKRIMTLAAIALAVSCGQNKPQKALILYYSQTGNTEVVAELFQAYLDADVEAIQVVNPYDADFGATIERCLKEREEGVLPEIEPIKADLKNYDLIVLGYPVWFGTYAPPIASLLNSIDLSGKKVLPFCTFGSGGLDSSVKDLEAKLPDSEILPGYGVRAARLDAASVEVERFMKEYGYVAGEYTKPQPFPDAHEVSEEESAIFDAAVDGYPMLHAKAEEVAARAVENGMEYLFTARDLPRPDAKPDAPAPGTIKVLVLVEDGAAPVFTQVMR
jgi:flavodoxin